MLRKIQEVEIDRVPPQYLASLILPGRYDERGVILKTFLIRLSSRRFQIQTAVVIKILVSGFFLFWIIKNENYNTTTLLSAFRNIKLALLFFGLTFLQLILGALRIKQLALFSSSQNLKLRNLIVVSWASSFITSIAPTSLLADLFRIQGLNSVEPSLGLENSVYVSMLPKVLSLLSLLLLSGITSFFVVEALQLDPFIPAFGLLLIGISLTSLFLAKKRLDRLFDSFNKWIAAKVSKDFVKNRLDFLFTFLKQIYSQPRILISSLALSIAIQVLNTLSFVAIIHTLFPSLDSHILYLICMIPIGILFMSLPLSFAGLGVGHIAFAHIMNKVGIQNGSDVFTVFFSLSLVFNTIGVIPFLIIRKKIFSIPKRNSTPPSTDPIGHRQYS